MIQRGLNEAERLKKDGQSKQTKLRELQQQLDD